MTDINFIEDIAHLIQLAVAPVFLLTGIAGLLSVSSGRLGRVTDRAREIETLLRRADTNQEIRDYLQKEAVTLWNRVHLINSSIRLYASAAIFVCLVVMVIFAGQFSSVNIIPVVALLFGGSMLLLLVGLLVFLREVHTATLTMKNGIQVVAEHVSGN